MHTATGNGMRVSTPKGTRSSRMTRYRLYEITIDVSSLATRTIRVVMARFVPQMDTVRARVDQDRCAAYSLEGGLDMVWRPLDVVAIEYYDDYRKVPARYRYHAFTEEGVCELIIYWLRGADIK